MERRDWIRERCSAVAGVKLIFIESFCDDKAIVDSNVLGKFHHWNIFIIIITNKHHG